METKSIYSDIAARTGGDIYIGVVGPVRTGKSTFIKRFMETMVIPNIESEFVRERAIDELPQSAAGKTIMTTEPKFVPEEGVRIKIDDVAEMNVRLIDCVGYIVPSSIGYIENDAPRMVVTPWMEQEIPFNMAAEIGTSKVIGEHSTIGLVITTDGSISDIPREEYAEAEARVLRELRAAGKPFVMLVNAVNPNADRTRALVDQLRERYGVTVMSVNCLEMGEAEIKEILRAVLYEFPVKEIDVDMPRWVSTLAPEHWLKAAVFGAVVDAASHVARVRELEGALDAVNDCEFVRHAAVGSVDLGRGAARMNMELRPELFYRIVSELTGLDISDDAKLVASLQEMAKMKRGYDKVASALQQVEATGYGIVMPTIDELRLEEPKIIKQGSRHGVKLRASAPSIHMMRADITTEVMPIVGSEAQSEELVKYLLQGFEEDTAKLWESNIFGKSLHELVSEGLNNKLCRMPQDARGKLQETVERIINEGCAGLICIII